MLIKLVCAVGIVGLLANILTLIWFPAQSKCAPTVSTSTVGMGPPEAYPVVRDAVK